MHLWAKNMLLWHAGNAAPRVVIFDENSASFVLDHDPFEFAPLNGSYIASP